MFINVKAVTQVNSTKLYRRIMILFVYRSTIGLFKTSVIKISRYLNQSNLTYGKQVFEYLQSHTIIQHWQLDRWIRNRYGFA